MTKQTRIIEVFTAGCPLCTETLNLVRKSVALCGCRVVERRCEGTEWCDEGKRYGVRAMPSVVVDGKIMFEGRITAEQAASLKR
jgi:alkyl hydroperoxide reductase subunit AhpF